MLSIFQTDDGASEEISSKQQHRGKFHTNLT